MKPKIKNPKKDMREVKRQLQVLRAKLADGNFAVEIEHIRPMNQFKAVLENGAVDSVISRDEFNKAVEGVMYVAPAHGTFVSPTGGFTAVTITTPTGEILKGKHNFAPKENYSKIYGAFKAIHKALKNNEF